MKRLILMRHAKSSWDSPALSDHERPLNKRGRNASNAMGHWLQEAGYVPGEILCSTAERTRETAACLGFEAPLTYLDRLYHASAHVMLRDLQTASANTVMMIGHNPGIADLAETLVQSRPRHDRFYDYPTCATLIVDFDTTDWAGLKIRTGQVVTFLTPHDLI